MTTVADAAGVSAEAWEAEAGSFTYDANGNQLTAPAPHSSTATTYDYQNLPLSLTQSGVTTTYRYDEIRQQSEPMATQTWESCICTAEEERDFVKLFLGPTLGRVGPGSRKIIARDHNLDLIYQRVGTVLADPEAAKYVCGIDYHWPEPWRAGR